MWSSGYNMYSKCIFSIFIKPIPSPPLPQYWGGGWNYRFGRIYIIWTLSIGKGGFWYVVFLNVCVRVYRYVASEIWGPSNGLQTKIAILFKTTAIIVIRVHCFTLWRLHRFTNIRRRYLQANNCMSTRHSNTKLFCETSISAVVYHAILGFDFKVVWPRSVFYEEVCDIFSALISFYFCPRPLHWSIYCFTLIVNYCRHSRKLQYL